jgi:hypothetical protein
MDIEAKLIRSCLVETSNILFLLLIIQNEIPKLHGHISLFWKDILFILVQQCYQLSIASKH